MTIHTPKPETCAGVYEIVNVTNGHTYIGSSVFIARRWAAHRNALRTGRLAETSKLRRAWEKYGERAFVFRILLVCAPEDCLMYEQRCIDAMSPRYNTRVVAESCRGVRFSPDVNAKKWARHVRHEVDGVRGTLKHLAEHFGQVQPSTAQLRVRRGWPVAEAVKTPNMDHGARGARGQQKLAAKPSPRGQLHTVAGVTGTLRELVAHFNVTNYQRARVQVNRGWTVERAVTGAPR